MTNEISTPDNQLIDTWDYQLKKGLMYADKNGATVKAEFLELIEPGATHTTEYLRLEQMISGLLFSTIDKFGTSENENTVYQAPVAEAKPLHEKSVTEHAKESEDLANMLPALFGTNQSVSLADFVKIFGKMAVNSVEKSICRVDGKVPLTRALWDKLSPVDAKGVAIAYCSFFVMPSLMDDLKESDSPSV